MPDLARSVNRVPLRLTDNWPMAIAEFASSGFSVFGDEVFTSTDLNRRSGEVLNPAREHPITISRNNEQFVLLRREHVARLFRTVNWVSMAVETMSEAQSVLSGGRASLPYSWLEIFDKDDLRKLCSEILEATRKATMGMLDWGEVEAIMHEWRESALGAIFTEEADECPLPHPSAVLQFAAEAESDSSCVNP
jgi:hypothetical protein